ncbi:uncharacterized protein VTP21DRAFT_6907 [Calcarisporiella thermophila]|uniref:uncharacterized protein n=1 Tax=Calcarisporiella thermophila TaxID=911321 RepID=UPI003742BD00
MEIWKRASNKLGFTTQQCKNKYDSLLKLWVAVEKKEGMTGSDVQVVEHRDHFERYHGSRENVSPSYKIPGPEYSTSTISVDDQNLGRIISESVEREENNLSTMDNEVGPSQESHFEDAEDVSDVEWATPPTSVSNRTKSQIAKSSGKGSKNTMEVLNEYVKIMADKRESKRRKEESQAHLSYEAEIKKLRLLNQKLELERNNIELERIRNTEEIKFNNRRLDIEMKKLNRNRAQEDE